jgi:hypothetical protein
MIIFCEKKHAEWMLENGFHNFMSSQDLSILARYLKYIGKNKTQIKEDLIEFCKRHNPEFNEVIYDKKIRWVIGTCDKYKLRIAMDIVVTEKELEIIKSVKNYKHEKILFVMLVIAKYFKHNRIRIDQHKVKNNENFYVNAKFTDILKQAKVNVTKKERNQLLFELNQTNLIESTLNGAYKINFVSENSDSMVLIGDIDNIIDYFPVFCVKCGKKMDKKSYKHDMCPDCYKEYRTDKIREHVRKHRATV